MALNASSSLLLAHIKVCNPIFLVDANTCRFLVPRLALKQAEVRRTMGIPKPGARHYPQALYARH